MRNYEKCKFTKQKPAQLPKNCTFTKNRTFTGKSFSEALILASTNPQYHKRLFIELPVQHMKTTSAEHGKNMFCDCSFHVLNLLSYCGLIDAKIRASDKDLPVQL